MTASTQHDVSGWVVFSAVVTLVAALANLIYGLTLLLNDTWIALRPGELVIFDVTIVGWIFLAMAGLQLFVAGGLLTGELWARVLGVIGATLSLLSQMAFLSVYPQWSWFVIGVDVLVIYGLTVHGGNIEAT